VKWPALLILLLAVQDESEELRRAKRIDGNLRASLEMLRQAAKSDDMEVRERALRVLREVDRRPILSREDAQGVILQVPELNGGLAEVLDELARISRVPIAMTPAAMAATAGQAVALKDRPNGGLATVLDELCRKMRLRWVVKEGAVLFECVPSVPSDSRVFKIDIRSLVRKSSNYPGPSGDLCGQIASARGRGVTFTLEEPEASPISSDDIVTLITENLDPEVWEQSDINSINMTPNQELVISAPKETLDKIEPYLKALERTTHVEWEGRIWFLAIDPSRAGGLEKELADGNWESVLSRAAEGKECEVLGTGRAMGFTGQRVSPRNVQDQWYVSEYREDGVPVLDRVTDGIYLDIRGIPERDSGLVLEMRLGITQLVEMETIQTSRGPIQNPHLTESIFRTTMSVEEDRPALLGLFPSYKTKSGMRSVAVVGRFRRVVPE
jgi:hypothetical protein